MSTLKNEKPAEEFIHPLTKKQVKASSFCWSDWLVEWEKTDDEKMLLNLLHIGFDIQMRNEQEQRARIIWYLESAYAHNSRSSIFKEWDYYNTDRLSLRGTLAQKAFSVLCQKLFREDDGCGYQKSKWFDDIVNEEILPKIFWFFRPQSAIPFDKEHNSIVARKFLFELAQMGWRKPAVQSLNGKISLIPENQKKLLEKYRPDFIWLLWQLDKLDFLWMQKEQITQEDVNALSDMAFAEANKFAERPYKRIEELLTKHSGLEVSAAKVVVVLKTYLHEKALREKLIKNSVSKMAFLQNELHAIEQEKTQLELFFSVKGLITHSVDEDSMLKNRLTELKQLITDKNKEYEAVRNELRIIQEH